MRSLFLIALLLAPTASAWSVDIRAPASAPEGVPFGIEVCARAEGRGQVRVLAANASLDVREDRYLSPFDGAACHALLVTPEGGAVELEARVRPESGSAAKARASARVEIERAAGELKILEAWAPPLAGFVVRNVGSAPALLALRTIDGARLPEATLAPGEVAFLGPVSPPGFQRHVAMELRVAPGARELAIGGRVESAIDVSKLSAGGSTRGPYGRTNLSAESFVVEDDIAAFATPGDTAVPLLVDEARVEVLVATHTLTSHDVAAALLRALDRGCRVRVLLEGAPPGGVPADERALVATLQARGAEVLVLGGEGARYRTMHAKLVVVDRAAALVATENLNEGNSRGFGLLVRDAALARAIADVMDVDAAPWHDVRPAAFVEPPAHIVPAVEPLVELVRFAGPHRATLVLSPDDPGALSAAIASARESVDVAMLRAEAQSEMIGALVEAARNGARVRVLLDGRHDDGVNRETVALLAGIAARENVSIEATLDLPDRTLHAKMFVVDNKTSYVGSMNWVRAAWSDNREAGLLVDDEALAAWLTLEFEKDRRREMPPRAEVVAPGWLVIAAFALSLRGLRRARPRRA